MKPTAPDRHRACVRKDRGTRVARAVVAAGLAGAIGLLLAIDGPDAPLSHLAGSTAGLVAACGIGALSLAGAL